MAASATATTTAPPRVDRALGSVLATPLLEMHEVVLATPLCHVPGSGSRTRYAPQVRDRLVLIQTQISNLRRAARSGSATRNVARCSLRARPRASRVAM